MRVSVICSDNPDDIEQVYCWVTDTVIPVNRWLCWIDYCRGILFCDMFSGDAPTVYFLRFPLDKFHRVPDDGSWFYRGVSAIDDGHMLKFVNVIRNDAVGHGALKPGGGFTIACYTLVIGDSMVWDKDMLGRMV
ncbi:hypothetical protein BS78_10G178900 [Paspalum vaginatum]|nr:hypothetical protein BS78_10G178900 [Paspalum vaginatum]